MTDTQYIWNYFVDKIGNEYGVSGLMGNLKAESGLITYRIQGDFSDGYTTSKDYTSKVDSGVITEYDFVYNAPNGGGYGLAQWTFSARKQALYNMYKSGNYSSIGCKELACDYLWYELQNDYKSVLNILKNATSIREASDKVLHDFENPADQSTAVEEKRCSLGEEIYNTYKGTTGTNANAEIIESAIEWCLKIANDDTHGYDQTSRWGPDYDCSSFLITAFEQSGCKVKTQGAVYTGDMIENFVACGFKEYTYSSDFELKRGDVLLRFSPSGHTEMYIGDGQNVGAHINENGTTTGGLTGDQTGKEIYVSEFAKSGTWETVLRLPTTGSVTPDIPDVPDIPDPPKIERKKMNKLLMFSIVTDRF